MRTIDRRSGNKPKARDALTQVEAFSQWAHPRNKDLLVTRGELVVILYNLKKQWDADRWYSKLLRWTRHGLLPKRGLRVDGGPPGETQPEKPGLVP